MILPLLPEDDPLLRQRSTTAPYSSETAQLLQDMVETAQYHNALGLAAVQVGVPIRLFIAWSEAEAAYIPFWNPTLHRLLKGRSIMDEGCLSVKDVYLPVYRPVEVDVYTTLHPLRGMMKKDLGEDLMLHRIVQHEMDHLDGILMTDLPEVDGIRHGRTEFS